MPEHLKSAPESEEFQSYLKTFVKQKEQLHRKKVLREAMTTLALMIAGQRNEFSCCIDESTHGDDLGSGILKE